MIPKGTDRKRQVLFFMYSLGNDPTRHTFAKPLGSPHCHRHATSTDSLQSTYPPALLLDDGPLPQIGANHLLLFAKCLGPLARGGWSSWHCTACRSPAGKWNLRFFGSCTSEYSTASGHSNICKTPRVQERVGIDGVLCPGLVPGSALGPQSPLHVPDPHPAFPARV